MSAVEYTRCDAPGCGRCAPEEPGSYDLLTLGWATLRTMSESYDLCPECARKAMQAVGLEGAE